jgi:excisionase family DNA binding protein
MTARLAYTIQETAASLGVSTDLVYDLVARGELHAVRAGRRKLIRAESLELWIERNTEHVNGNGAEG